MKLSFMFLLLSVLCFFLVQPLYLIQKRVYLEKERFYESPIYQSPRSLFLRNDSYGKGYFAASRSNGRRHKGLDILAPVGQPILASKSGRIILAGEEKGYGQFVRVLHPDGLTTTYAHLSAIWVRKGEWVEKNQVVGNCGKTGNADHPNILAHLHFEIRNGNQALDPGQKLLDPAIFIQ